jgi:hypothetical protein
VIQGIAWAFKSFSLGMGIFLLGGSTYETGPIYPAAIPATPLYPNLHTLEPLDLHFGTVTINGTTHNVLRFSNSICNSGEGWLELRAKTVKTTSGKNTRVTCRIYDDEGGYANKQAGDFVYHASHNHFYVGNLADSKLWPRADYDR